MEKIGARNIGLVVTHTNHIAVLDPCHPVSTQSAASKKGSPAAAAAAAAAAAEVPSVCVCVLSLRKLTCMGLKAPAEGGIIAKLPIQITRPPRDANLREVTHEKTYETQTASHRSRVGAFASQNSRQQAPGSFLLPAYSP